MQSRTDQRLAWGLVKSQQAFPFLATTRLAVSVSIYWIGLFRTILYSKGAGVRPFRALRQPTRWWLVDVWRGDVIGTILRVETRSSQIWDKVLRTYGLKLSNLPIEGASDPPYIPRGSGEGLSMRRPVRVGRRRRGRPNMGVVPACGGQACKTPARGGRPPLDSPRAVSSHVVADHQSAGLRKLPTKHEPPTPAAPCRRTMRPCDTFLLTLPHPGLSGQLRG